MSTVFLHNLGHERSLWCFERMAGIGTKRSSDSQAGTPDTPAAAGTSGRWRGPAARGYCAGIVTSGSLSGLPVSAIVKKNITAVSARFAAKSLPSIQNQRPW